MLSQYEAGCVKVRGIGKIQGSEHKPRANSFRCENQVMGPVLVESRAPVATPRCLVYCLTPSELGDRYSLKWRHRYFCPNSGFTKDLHCKLQCKSLVNPQLWVKNTRSNFQNQISQ